MTPDQRAAQIEAEFERLQNEMAVAAKAKAEQDAKQREIERKQVESAKALKKHFEVLTGRMVEAGESVPAIVAAHIQAADKPDWTSLTIAESLLKDPLNAFSMASDGFHYQGRAYASLEAVQERIERFCGVRLPNIRPLVRAVLAGDDTVIAAKSACLTYHVPTPEPDNLTLTDVFKLRSMLGQDALG